LVVHEGAKKVLASADHYLHCYVGKPNRLHVRVCGGAVHLYAFLEEAVSSKQ
jgi:hypothetical protein